MAADKLRKTTPLRITFAQGEQPTSAKLNALSNQLRSSTEVLEQAIGDPWNTGGDATTSQYPLYIANLARVMGSYEMVNPSLYYVPQTFTFRDYVGDRYAGKSEGFLVFPPMSAGTFAAGGTLNIANKVASISLVTTVGKFFIDSTEAKFHYYGVLASGDYIEYQVDPSSFKYQEEYLPGIIPDPRQTAFDGCRISTSGGKYYLHLPPRQPLNFSLGKDPNSSPERYPNGAEQAATANRATTIGAPYTLWQYSTTALADGHYRYKLCKELQTFLDSGPSAGDIIPQYIIWLWNKDSNSIVQDAVFRHQTVLGNNTWIFQVESTSVDLSLYVTADESQASYNSSPLVVLTVGASLAQNISRILHVTDSSSGYSANTHAAVHSHSSLKDQVPPISQATPYGYTNGFGPSYWTNDPHVHLLSRSIGASDRDVNKNAMLSDLVIASATASGGNQLNTGNASYKLRFGNYSSSPFIYGNSNNLYFGTSSSEQMTLESTGHLGIGTTDPYHALDVRIEGIAIVGTGSYSEVAIRERGGTVRTVGSWHWAVRGDIGGDNDNLKLVRFITGTFTDIAMTVENSTGNVGIGANSLSSNIRLAVVDTNSNRVEIGKTFSRIVPGTNNGGAIYFGPSISTGTEPTGAIEASWQDVTNPSFGIGVIRDGLGANIIMDYSSNTYLRNGTTNNIHVNNIGHVGVGVTGPTFRLDVQDNNTSGDGHTLRIKNTNSLGTGHNYTVLRLEDHDAAVTNYLYIDSNGTSTLGRVGTYFGNSTSHDLGIFSSNIERLTVKSDGNIGIGNTNPQTRLDLYFPDSSDFGVGARIVKSNISGAFDGARLELYKSMTSSKSWTIGIQEGTDISAFSIAEDGGYTNFGTTRLVILAGGSVGIGTINPAGKLHVESNTDTQQLLRSFISSAAQFPYLFMDKARGTSASPSSVLNGDDLSRIYARGYNAGDWRNATIIRSIVDGAPGATNVPGKIEFHTGTASSDAILRAYIDSAGLFTTLYGMNITGNFSVSGNTTLGDAAGDILTINGTAVTIPNSLNFDSNTLYIDAANNRVGINTASPTDDLDVRATIKIGNGTDANIIWRPADGSPDTSLSWVLATRNDVGGTNHDLKLLRYVSDSHQDNPIQFSNAYGSIGIGGLIPGSSAKVDIYGTTRSQTPTDAPYGFMATTVGTDEKAFLATTGGNVNHSGMLRLTDGNASNAIVAMRNTSLTTINYFTTAGSNYLMGGGLGIGTTTPSDELHLLTVSGDSRMWIESTDGSSYDQSIAFKDPTATWYIGQKFNVLDAFGIGRTTDKNDLVINASGYVGQGIDPFSKFTTYHTATVNPSLTWGQFAAVTFRDENAELAMSLSATAPYPWWIQARNSSSAANDMAFQPKGGNLLFGETEVNKTTETFRYFYIPDKTFSYGNSPGTITYGEHLIFRAAGTTGALWGAGAQIIGGDVTLEAGDAVESGNNGTAPGTYKGGDVYITAGAAAYPGPGLTPTNVQGKIYFRTATNATVDDTSYTTRMTVVGTTGRVGIATTSPATKLEVREHTTTTNALVEVGRFTAHITSQANTALTGFGATLSIAGQVPLGLLNATDLIPMASFNSAWENDGGAQHGRTNITFSNRDLTNPSSSALVERMRITSSGNVGIGTSPSYRFHVYNGAASDTVGTIESGTAGYGTGLFLKGNDSAGSSYNSIQSLFGSTAQWRIGGPGVANTFTIETNATERLRVASGGNVGIGTTNPDTRLRIEGDYITDRGTLYVKSSNHSYIVTDTSFASGEIGYIWQREGTRKWVAYVAGPSNDLIFNDGTNRVTFEAGGNVGIGTTNPAYLLDVNGTINANVLRLAGGTNNVFGMTYNSWEFGADNDTDGCLIDIHASATWTDYSSRIYRAPGENGTFNINNRGTGTYALGQQDAGALQLFTNNINRLHITSGGYVGIGGITAPVSNLEIRHVDGNQFGTALTLYQIVGSNHDGVRLAWYKDMTTDKAWSAGVAEGENVNRFSINEDGYHGGFGTERFTILAGGNTGIGITAPTSRLHIYQSDGSTDLTTRIENGSAGYASVIRLVGGDEVGSRYNEIRSQYGVTNQWYLGSPGVSSTFVIGTSGTERIRIDSSGDVGIGNSDPQTYLVIGSNGDAGASLPGVRLQASNTNYFSASDNTKTVFMGTDASSYAIVGTFTGHDLGFRTNNTLRMIIDAGGEVGIGLSTTTAKLSISTTGSELSGSTRSTTLTTNSGVLGGTAGDSIKLASIGFSSSNSSYLGIKAYRHTSTNSWEFASIGLQMDVDNTEHAGAGSLWLGANGVGISNTKPEYPLHLKATGDTGITIESTGDATYNQYIQFKDTASTWFIGNRYSNPVNGFGIGKTVEKNELTITPSGRTRVSSKASFTATGTASASAGTITGSGTSFLSELSNGDYVQVSTTYGQITSISTDTSATWDSTASIGGGSSVTVYPSPFGANNDLSAGWPDFMVSHLGNIEIGTAQETVTNLGSIHYQYTKIRIYEHINTVMRALHITNPSTNSAGQGAIYFDNSGTAQGVIALNSSNNSTYGSVSSFNIGSTGSSAVSIFTNGTSRIYINSSGDVGIGTIVPQNKLDVEGGVAIGATYSGTSSAPSNGLIVQGNVGLGQTTASSRLEVTGDVGITGNFKLQSTTTKDMYLNVYMGHTGNAGGGALTFTYNVATPLSVTIPDGSSLIIPLPIPLTATQINSVTVNGSSPGSDSDVDVYVRTVSSGAGGRTQVGTELTNFSSSREEKTATGTVSLSPSTTAYAIELHCDSGANAITVYYIKVNYSIAIVPFGIAL